MSNALFEASHYFGFLIGLRQFLVYLLLSLVNQVLLARFIQNFHLLNEFLGMTIEVCMLRHEAVAYFDGVFLRHAIATLLSCADLIDLQEVYICLKTQMRLQDTCSLNAAFLISLCDFQNPVSAIGLTYANRSVINSNLWHEV